MTDDALGIVRAADPPTPLERLLGTFRNWLYLPDAAAFKITLGAVVANLMPGDPIWLLLVGPTGSGKTELIDPLMSLRYNMHAVGTLTEAALLSGTAKRDKASDANGGLLRAIGTFGFLLLKDFTSVLSMGGEMRGPLLAALREIHDGHWTRHVGTDGGRALEWAGKCALIGGCTPAIDQHHRLMAAMGERFMLCRIPLGDPQEQATRAMQHIMHEKHMRGELREAVRQFFDGLRLDPRTLEAGERGRIAALATFAARARSSVERDNYMREIDFIPPSEMPARLACSLTALIHGLEALGMAIAEAWQLAARVALDSIPEIRLRVLRFLARAADPAGTTDVAEAIHHPTTTTRRSLEDLTGHCLASRIGDGPGKEHLWQLTGLATSLLVRAEVAL